MFRKLVPGLLLSALIALFVSFISKRVGGPAMLYALLFGMAFHFLCENERYVAGIRFASRTVLRIGVALLGFRITSNDVLDLGWPVIALVVSGVVVTIFVGWGIGRLCRLSNDHAVLSAGSVSICGASAALAIASVLPAHEHHERNTILTVAAVTALSTVAMVVYPVIVSYLGFDNHTAGIFLGATIHDVAQVVGAGYIVSNESGEISTLVKLMRVACLVPVVLAIAFVVRGRGTVGERREPLLPWFLVGFVACLIINSAGWLPESATRAISPISSWCLLTAVAALGVRTSLKALAEVGPWPVAAMILQTAFLAVFVLAGLTIIG